MRVFIAIELPDHVKSKLFHEVETLERKKLFKGEFVSKKNLHLTLKFLGEISGERVEEIKKKLRKVKFEKISCSVGKIGIFDNEKYIKVIWVDLLSKDNNLLELQEEIAGKFLEIPSDYKKFSSHITLARVKSVINKQKLVEEIKRINFKKLDFEVDNFVLMKSELMREKGLGPQYKILEEFKLN